VRTTQQVVFFEEIMAEGALEDNGAGGMVSEINVQSFEEIRIDAAAVRDARGAWNNFVGSQSSRDVCGEAIYAAFYDAVPSLQKLFTTPRAVQAMRFFNALDGFVKALDEPTKLKSLVEAIGFGHLNFDVTIPRILLFRDALADLFSLELGDKWTSMAQAGWMTLLNYIGGAIVYCKQNYAERIEVLGASWAKVRETKEGAGGGGGETMGTMGSMKDKAKDAEGGEGEEGEVTEASQQMMQNVPKTYTPMFLFNAAVMGIGDRLWMHEVLAVFDNMVMNASNPARLQEECNVLAVRINKCKLGQSVILSEYKSCMLASLRSLLPKDWSGGHEVAWTWLWENVERLIQDSEVMKRGNVLERALARLIDGLEEDQKYELRQSLYSTFFGTTPAGEDHFKQSNTYLHLVADKVLGMTLQFYREPIQMVDDISALGLRHVGYGIPTELFPPYVEAWCSVLVDSEFDQVSIDAFRCSLTLISKMQVRTVIEGSTLVMKAINANSGAMIVKAIACAPRGERANWMLLVQVGTQNISPLEWSIKNGQLNAGTVMLQDLLTIRADRDRYYYAKDDIFERHPDTLKILLDNAPDMVPVLLDGLMWRSTINENGNRRVNYYVKHLIKTDDGGRPDTFENIANYQDPRLVCHPMLVVITDIVWTRAVYSTFLGGKMWLFFTLTIFICSQSIPVIADVPVAIFACRMFVYLLSMSQLIYTHVKRFIVSFGAGDVGKVFCLTLPNYLGDWRESASLALAVALFVMFGLEPILGCWKNNDGIWFSATCSAADGLDTVYSRLSMFAMILYYLLLMDLTVFSNKLSAYVLVCGQLASELGLFLLALLAVVVICACSLSCLEQEVERFHDIPSGGMTVFEMFLKMLPHSEYATFNEEPVILLGVYIFLIIAAVFLINLLVAQFTCSYKSVFNDMVGYARLGRIRIVVDTLPRVSKKKWAKCITSLHLDKKLQFNEGDIGPSGGIQMLEPASVHPTSVDAIRRFGGSTSPTIMWPEADTQGDGDEDRFERLEKLIQRTTTSIQSG
jgi:hemoglobin-like flavoprotein